MAAFHGNLCKGSQCRFAGSSTVFVGCGFQCCPPGTEVAGKAICLNCRTRQRESLALAGQAWTDFSIAGIPRAESHDLSCRQQGEWATDRVPGSLPSTCSWIPPSWVGCRFALHFATLPLANKQHGRLMSGAQSAQTSIFQLFSYAFDVFWGKRNKIRMTRCTPSLQQLTAMLYPAGLCSPWRSRITKRWTWWWTENLPPRPACWFRIKNHSQPGDFSLNSSNPC